jgi:hypothetical protein
MIIRTTRMSTRVPRPMYTGSPFESSSTAGSRMGVLVREVCRRVAARPARGHATTASFTQAAFPSTSLREPEPHSHNHDDLDKGDKNPYPDFHVDPPSVGRPCLPATARRANELLVFHVQAFAKFERVCPERWFGDAIARDVTNRLGLIRKRNAARTSREIPTPASGGPKAGGQSGEASRFLIALGLTVQL